MNKIVRWWGLVVFVVLVGGTTAAVVLLSDRMVKYAVESWGTDMNGARVDLDRAQLNFSPFGFALENLQIASSKEPMQNALQIAHIKFAIDGYGLLRRKLVITDMSMEGIRTHTPRTTSGALPAPPQEPEPEPEPETSESSFALPAMELPSVRDFVGGADLQSAKLAEQFGGELAAAKEQWQQRVAQLPSEAALTAYPQRLKAARPSMDGNTLQDVQEIARAVKDLEKIRDDARVDLEKVQGAKNALRDDLGVWSGKTKELLAAPGADLAQLKSKYSLDANGVGNLSAALFGPQVAEWARSARYWYGKAKPFITKRENKPEEIERQRLRGVDVTFTDRYQVPDFLIRSIKVSVDVTAGKMQGEIRNVTTDQPTLGHPLTFSFFGENLHGLQDLEIEGTFNHVEPKAAVDQMRLKARGIAIDRYDVLKAKSFPLRLENSALDLESQVELKNGSELKGGINVTFKSVNFVTDLGGDRGELGQVVANALADVKHFAMKAEMSGTLRKYDVDLRSDLDELLRAAFNRQFRDRVDRFLADAKAQLDARVQQSTQQLQAKVDELKGFERTIEQRRRQAEDALQQAEADLRAAVEQQKTAAEQKRDDAKQQVKSAAEEQKKNAADKTKQAADKLLKGLK